MSSRYRLILLRASTTSRRPIVILRLEASPSRRTALRLLLSRDRAISIVAGNDMTANCVVLVFDPLLTSECVTAKHRGLQ